MSMNAPDTFTAGDTASWSETFPDYAPADGWVLLFRLLWPTGTACGIQRRRGRGGRGLSASPPPSLKAGPLARPPWWPVVQRGTAPDLERKTLGSQPITIQPNLAVVATHDPRTQNERALADCRAALAAYVRSGQFHVQEHDVDGRRISFRSADEIRALIEFYEREVAYERALAAALTGQTPGRVRIRM